LKLAFLPKQINNPYLTILDNAGIEAAKICLSDELPALQEGLQSLIEEFDGAALDAGLLHAAQLPSPIRFIEIGDEDDAVQAGAALKAAGYFVNVAVFPAVPRRRAGLRIMINCHHTKTDVRELVREQQVLAEPGGSEPLDLAHGRAGERLMAVLRLQARERHALVRLDVRTQPRSRQRHRHRREVVLEVASLDEQRRGGEVERRGLHVSGMRQRRRGDKDGSRVARSPRRPRREGRPGLGRSAQPCARSPAIARSIGRRTAKR